MSGSRLKENVSSETMAGYNALLPKSAARQIFVYVESDEDISFWRNVLHQYESGAIEFKIQTATHKGKTGALERNNDLLLMKVGEYLIICIDSDYDYILPELTPQSILINENPHIFQTYSYSIENLLCYSESLHALCVQSTKHDKKVIDFNEFLKTFSNIIYPLFLWNIYIRKKHNDTTFTISDFCETIKLVDKIDIAGQFSTAITGLKTRVDEKIALLKKNNPLAIDEVEKIAVSLRAMGVDETNTYLFIHGHTLKDNVVLMVLKPVCLLLIAEKYAQIKKNVQHQTQEENDRNHYKNQIQDISTVLNSNTEYKNCFLYQKIKADLDNYVATLS